MNASEFLGDVHGLRHINFRCIRVSDGDVKTPEFGMFDVRTEQMLDEYNRRGYEIYHVVNSGGYKDEQIDHVNAIFIDLDCGRDAQRRYWPKHIVDAYKNLKLYQIKQFDLQPSYIIETRNGLQVYWLMDGTVTREHYTSIVQHLAQVFDADKQSTNIARLMRVPGYKWCKNRDEDVTISIIQHNRIRYSIDDIIRVIPFSGTNKEKYNTFLFIESQKTLDNNIDMIRRGDCDTLRDKFNVEPVECDTHINVYDRLKQMDVREYLGVSGKNFACLFHDDVHASATVMVNKTSGHQIYKCFSESCEFGKGNIIQLTEHIQRINRYDALRFLRKVYSVHYTESDFQRYWREVYEENKRLIRDGEMEEMYPELYKRIKRYLPELFVLHDVASDHVTTEKFSDDKDTPIFYASKRYIAHSCGNNGSKTTDRTALFSFLGLVNKLAEEDVPTFLMERAKHESTSSRYSKTVNFFSIPAYGDILMRTSQRRAVEFSDSGMRVSGLGYESFLRTFGEETANSVYPQMKGHAIPTINKEVSSQFERIVNETIQERGWVTESQVLSDIREYFTTSKTYNERQLKRTIPEMLDKYGLKRIRLNNRLKQKFHIEIAGFPIVIVRDDDNTQEVTPISTSAAD